MCSGSKCRKYCYQKYLLTPFSTNNLILFQGAYVALFGSLTMTLWVGLGGIIVYPPNNPKKPLTTDNCGMMTSASSNYTTILSNMTTTSYISTTNMSYTTMMAADMEER